MALTKIDDRGLNTPIDLLDDEKIRFGTGNDLEIYHDGTTNRVHSVSKPLLIKTIDGYDLTLQTNSEDAVVCKGNAAVELYHNNVKKFETTSTGTNTVGTHVDDGANHDGDVNFYGVSSYNAQWDKSDASLKLLDNAKIKIGSGDDLQLYHDGSHSNINNSTGNLRIQTDAFRVNSQDNSESIIRADKDGAVELYYDNSKKLETTNSGVLLGGSLYANDNTKLILGTGEDLKIYHDGTNSISDFSTGDLYFRNRGSSGQIVFEPKLSETGLKIIGDGAVELYYDNSKKLETYSDGIKVYDDVWLPDDGILRLGTRPEGGDLHIYHDGSHSYIDDVATGDLKIRSNGNGVVLGKTDGENTARFLTDGAVELYYDNSKKLETTSGGISVTGNVAASNDIEIANDTGKIKLGTGTDLEIYHDGSHNYLEGSSHEIRIRSDDIRFRNAANNKTMLYAHDDGAVELYYDNSKKFETTDSGAKWYGASNGNGSFTYDNITSNNNKHAEYRFERSGSSRGLCSIVYIGENSSSQGEVLIYSSGGNANISGGVQLVDGATSWVSASDMRLKDKTGDITNALTDIAKIEPIKFTWKADTNKTPHVGVSAQSVENVVPEAISKSKDKLLEEKGDDTEYLGVRYTELIPLCIAALKEAKTKIETLETKVAALEAA